MTVQCCTFVFDLNSRYKLLCQENKRLTGYFLQTFTVKSQLSCFKECEITQECKSVNVLKEDVNRYTCELNSCSEILCENLNSTSSPYKHFYKIGKILTKKLFCNMNAIEGIMQYTV